MLVAKAEVSYYAEENIERPKKTVIKKKKQKKTNFLFKLISMSIAIIILLVSMFILIRYAGITSIRFELTNLEKEIYELENKKLNLIAELEGVKSSLKVAEDATYKLGMDYPTVDQVIYVSVEENNLDVVEEINIANRLKRILSVFSSLF